jgi:hypothetical protein
VGEGPGVTVRAGALVRVDVGLAVAVVADGEMVGVDEVDRALA